MIYIHNKTVTEKKYLTKLPCENKLIFKYMICKSAAWPVTFGVMVEFQSGNHVVIYIYIYRSNPLCHQSFFINHSHTEMHMKYKFLIFEFWCHNYAIYRVTRKKVGKSKLL